MSDDKSKTGPADASKISLSEDYEVTYWRNKFGCSKAELEAAVKAVGNGAKAVEEYFAKNPPKG